MSRPASEHTVHLRRSLERYGWAAVPKNRAALRSIDYLRRERKVRMRTGETHYIVRGA